MIAPTIVFEDELVAHHRPGRLEQLRLQLLVKETRDRAVFAQGQTVELVFDRPRAGSVQTAAPTAAGPPASIR